jgi:hypothetical protein
MLILVCSQGCYGRTDGSVTISLRNFVGEGIINKIEVDNMRDVAVSAATFRQHMRMACLFPNLFDTPELADSTAIS